MTLHAVIGEGSINPRELAHQLDDLWEKALKEKDNFWLLVQGKAEPTKADQDLLSYCAEKEIFVATIAHEDVELDEAYSNADEGHTFDGDFAAALVEAMTELQEDEEGADLLAILVNPKEDDERDTEAVGVIEAVIDAGFKVYGLNDSMEDITLEAPEEPVAPKKSSKKAAAAAAEVEDKNERGPYTRSELDGLTDPELKALANGMGITGRGRKAYIEGIMGQGAGDTSVSEDTKIVDVSPGDQVLVVIHSANGIQVKRISPEAAAAL